MALWCPAKAMTIENVATRKYRLYLLQPHSFSRDFLWPILLKNTPSDSVFLILRLLLK